MDPKFEGVGFTEGCKGCRAIVNGKRPVAHSQECRLRVMEQAPSNERIAARVRQTMDKDQEFHARNLERNEERRKRESDVPSPSEPVSAGSEGSEGVPRAHEGESSSSSSLPSTLPPAVAPASPSRKRGAGDQLDQARQSPGLQSGWDPLERPSPTKRPAEGDPDIRWRTGDESGPQSREDEAKERRLDLIEDLVGVLEDEAVQVRTGDGEVQMRVCEEPLDLSFIASPEAELLRGASEMTDVGGVCSSLSDR